MLVQKENNSGRDLYLRGVRMKEIMWTYRSNSLRVSQSCDYNSFHRQLHLPTKHYIWTNWKDPSSLFPFQTALSLLYLSSYDRNKEARTQTSYYTRPKAFTMAPDLFSYCSNSVNAKHSADCGRQFHLKYYILHEFWKLAVDLRRCVFIWMSKQHKYSSLSKLPKILKDVFSRAQTILITTVLITVISVFLFHFL